MKNNEKPDILSRIRNMKFRKELTALLAFFVMISTSYAMIHPGEALNNNVARSFMFFNEEEGTETDLSDPEKMNALMDADMESGNTADPVQDDASDPQLEEGTYTESPSSEPADQNSYPPTSTPAESVTPVFDSTAAPVVSASTEPEGKETSEPTGTPESLVSASPEASENTETADPENSPSASPDATESTVPSSSPTTEPTGSPEAEEEELYPATDFGGEITPLEEDDTETKENIKVVINAPQGAFPEGTTVKVVLVRDTEILDAIEKAAVDASEDKVTVKQVQAVDITFFDKDGNEIQPLKSIAVSFKSELVKEAENTTVVHVKQDENKENIIDTKTVGTIEKPEDSDLVDSIEDNEVVIEADSFSVYGIVGTETLTTQVITAEGDTYTIEVMYGSEANIPKDAMLEAREIEEGSSEYQHYLENALTAMTSDSEVAEDANMPEKVKTSTTELDDKSDIDARFFDIEIKDANGEKIEPDATVQVSIKYEGTVIDEERTTTKAVHFTEDEVSIVDTDVSVGDEGASVITFKQDSFSVTGTITQKLADGWPADGDYVLILKPAGKEKYYAVNSQGELLEVEYNAQNNEVTFENLVDVGQVDAFKWTLSTHSNYPNYKELKNGSTYIDPYYSNNHAMGSYAQAYLYTNSNGNIRDYDRDNYLIVDEGNMQIGSVSSGSTSSRAVAFFATNFKLDESQGEEPGGDPVLGVPDTNKVLKPNGDGTYTLSLSVTGKAEEQPVDQKADVIIILDRSGSMLYGKNDNTAHRTKDENRRDYIAQQAIDDLAKDLLDNNIGHPDRVRLAFITFDDMATTRVNVTDSAASNYDQFKAIVDTADGIDGHGTNWEAGLLQAENMTTRPGADVYVVFVSDGNPTYWVNDDGSRGGRGTSTSTATSYSQAKPVAKRLVDNKHMDFYSVSVFGNADRMEMLVKYVYTGSDYGETKKDRYQTASDSASLKQAFDTIIQNITKNFEYTNVSFVDEITDYTATVMVDGTADNITVTVKDADGNVTHSEDSYVKPVFDDGTATLKFTDGYSLKKGYTYTASFTVWPTQTAYDRIAALNNGAIFTAEDAANGITYMNGQYSLNTNSNAQVNYSTVTRETGKDPVIVPQEPIKNIPCLDEDGNPASIPLGTTGMYFQKVWYVGLQESQFTRMQSWTYEKGEEPLLHVGYRDSSSATPDADLDKTFEVMPIHNNVTKISGEGEPAIYETLREKWAIAPGIMVTTLPEGAEAKATWTYNGTTYYALETGHDYTITEDYISGNFEPVNETYHPMFFGDKLMNVKLDGNTIVSMEEMDPELLTVKNWLRGGINVTKTVKDPEGNVVTSDDTEFQVTITVNAPTADAANYPTWYKDTETTTKQPIKVVWYDTYANAEDLASGTIMYGVNGKPAEGESTGEDNYANNLNYMEFVNGVATKTLTLKAGQTIRVTNLLRNSTYSVTEVKPNGYEVTYDNASGSIASNEEHNVSVINTQTTTEITVLKADSKTKNPIVDANAEFELYSGRTQLYMNKTDGSTITVEAYNSLEETEKANYTDRVKIVDGSVGTKIILTPGTYRLVEKEPPKGYIIATSAVYFKVSNTVELCDESGNVIDSSDGASVNGKYLTIYNTAGQSLPNTGGSGTLPYTLGGIALIMASALMYGFRMRRRERRLN